MLQANILNSDASVNNFKVVPGVDFMLGNSFNLVFQIIDPNTGNRFIPPSTAVVKVTLYNFDTTTIVKTTSLLSTDDRSIQVISLASTDTTQLYGGNLTFTVDLLGDGTQILYGLIYQALNKIAVPWGANGQ